MIPQCEKCGSENYVEIRVPGAQEKVRAMERWLALLGLAAIASLVFVSTNAIFGAIAIALFIICFVVYRISSRIRSIEHTCGNCGLVTYR